MKRFAAGHLVRISSATLRRESVELNAGEILRAPGWSDAIVFVTAGEIHVECRSGAEHCFSEGAVLCFRRLPVGAVHNRGREIARLLVIRRNTTG
ncbi:MAG TPA: hypothetical protein VHC49_12370 [Mycobacteriales bacterium]|nr:hypothetical protein [Mycobacteriales bacterium]